MLGSLLRSMIECAEENPLVGESIHVLDITWNDTIKTDFVWNTDGMSVELVDVLGNILPPATHPDRLTFDDVVRRMDEIASIDFNVNTLPLCFYTIHDNRCSISNHNLHLFAGSDKVVQQLRTLGVHA
jgi:hypothetical protein